MPPNPILIPRLRLSDPSRQTKIDPVKSLCGIPTPAAFAAITALLVAKFNWSFRWLISGAPLLSYNILLGASKGFRILPFVHLWTLLVTVHLLYAIAATSWLLYGFFVAACYPAAFLTCLVQFEFVANLVRRNLRTLLKQLQFVNDKVAFFNIPALEIDTEVSGLMVVRGVTFHLSTLTVVAHGVELGIKVSDDMEIAIQTETVTISLLRRIEIADVYCNIKGGEHEMTFHNLEDSTQNTAGDPMMNSQTPLLRAATFGSDTSEPPISPQKVRMTQEMTNGCDMKDSSAKAGLDSVTRLSPEDAKKQYYDMLEWIQETNTIQKCRVFLKDLPEFDESDTKELRAAICSQIHDTPSVPHPPQRSVKITTLQNLSSRRTRQFMHRLPMLLRVLLNPLAYFHPISIESITASCSGKWIKSLLVQQVFQQYGEADADIRRLEARVSKWLADASFAIEFADVKGLAQVPILTEFDINAWLGFGDVMVYRTMPHEVTQKEVVRLGGADATFSIPSFLLPHHEHILPPYNSEIERNRLEEEVENADGKPKTVQAEQNLRQAEKDEANIRMSVHASLPACFDQELLNFIAALVKATKVVEMEKEGSTMDGDYGGFKDFAFKGFTRDLHQVTKDGMKKAVVGGIVNDKWIAKMVGKITKKLETAQGDVGYSGNIPVELAVRRPKEGEKLPSKLLA